LGATGNPAAYGGISCGIQGRYAAEFCDEMSLTAVETERECCDFLEKEKSRQAA
jgi:hypothetical protein